MRLRRSRMLRLVVTALAFGLMAITTAAQTPYVPYFNKNKVRYDRFAWRMRPLALAHEVLCRRGQDDLAARWREFIAGKTRQLSDDLLAELADRETRRRRVYFCGRLAQYRYFNTDEVILEALQCFMEIQTRCVPSPQPSASSLLASTV